MQSIQEIQTSLPSVTLSPTEFPPADIVRDTPREELLERVRRNAEKIGLTLTEEHWQVIDFLFDFYAKCCDSHSPRYLEQQVYWRYVDRQQQLDQVKDECDEDDLQCCPHGRLGSNEALKAYRVYRVLLKAFRDQGGKRFLYEHFPYGPLYTIHLLAQLPRLMNDADTHSGTAY